MNDDLIRRSDAIYELEDMRAYRVDEDGYLMIYKSDAIDRIHSIPSADRPSAVYEYLKRKIGDIVDSETEFDAWFKRMVWHVEECNRLANRPQGEWIGEADGYYNGELVYDTWYCSNCDYVVDDDEPPTWNYCPNCGADMRGKGDE